MEKKLEAQLDAESMTAVNVKEYAPSEAFSSAEPPPAYQRPKSTVVQVARIAAVTVVLTSFILGGFIFAAAWVQANSACQDALNEQLARMDQMLEDRAAMGPQFQALIGEQGDAQGDSSDSDQQPQSASQHSKREEPRQEQDSGKDRDDKEDDQQENAVDPPIHLKLPLQLDFDDLAGALMERNQRSRMNCVVEKRRAEEVVDHQPRTVRLPFGLNLTTDPRYEHVSGERMAIFCESGNDQRHIPMDQMQPIVVPIQQAPMQPTHQQVQQQMQQQHQQQMQQQLQQQIQMHLQQQMQRQHEEQMQRQQQQQQQQQFGPPPQQQMPIQVLPMSHAEARGFQQHQTPLVTMHAMHAPQHVPLAAAQGFEHDSHPPRQGRLFPNLPQGPAPSPRGRGFQGQGVPLELRGVPVQAAMTVEVEGRDGPIEMEGRSLTPQQLQHLEQLHQLQQMQPQDGSGPQILPIEVIEARAFQHPQDMQQAQQPQGPPAPLPADTLRPPYQRTPIHAVPPQEEEPRPHYVQPRSVRSVDALLHREKRVRRCACDCNC